MLIEFGRIPLCNVHRRHSGGGGGGCEVRVMRAGWRLTIHYLGTMIASMQPQRTTATTLLDWMLHISYDAALPPSCHFARVRPHIHAKRPSPLAHIFRGYPGVPRLILFGVVAIVGHKLRTALPILQRWSCLPRNCNDLAPALVPQAPRPFGPQTAPSTTPTKQP